MTTELTQFHKNEFNEKGYLILENVLRPAEAEKVRAAVMELARMEQDMGGAYFYVPQAPIYDDKGRLVDSKGHDNETGRAQRVWNLLNKGPIFGQIIQKQVIVDCMNWIFDRKTPHQKYFLSSLQAHILHPGASHQPLHIDTPVPEPLPEWVIKANTIWVLEPFTETNGATECLPGSHRLRHKPTADDQTRTDLVKLVAPAGSVIVTHGALWHRGGGNRTAKERAALLGSFAASYAREIADEENYSLVLDRSVVESASAELLTMLGLEHGIRPGARNPVKVSTEL